MATAGHPPAGAAPVRWLLAGLVVAAGATMFLLARPEPGWLLWLSSLGALVATEGSVRLHPRWGDAGTATALPYTLLPAIVVVAGGYFLDETVDGYWRLAAGLGLGALTAFTVFGEYHTVSPEGTLYDRVRTSLAVLTFGALFALAYVLNEREVSVPLGAALVGLAAMALAIELLREAHLVNAVTPLVALAVGTSLAELQLALYFFPLDALLVSAIVVLGFYLATGIVHHLLERDLGPAVAAEYAIVTGIGIAAVVLTLAL